MTRSDSPGGAPDAPRTAAQWRTALGLEELPVESGWWAPVYRSALQVEAEGRTVAASSAIYYLLDEEKPVNHWHWLACDDVHVLIDGGPVRYVMVPDGQPPQHRVLGRDTAKGQSPVIAVPAGCHKTLTLVEADGFALIGSVVTPAWEPESVRFGPPGTENSPIAPDA